MCKTPLPEIYSEEPPAQQRQYKSDLSNLQTTLSLFLGKRPTSKGSPFQVEGPHTMEYARRCLVTAVARGTKSWPETMEQSARRPDTLDRFNNISWFQ